MSEREELAAAIALHFGMLPKRQGIPLKELYHVAALGAEAFSEILADTVSWGDDADLNQTLHNFAVRIIEYRKKESKLPDLDHLKTLAKESLYYFMEPKFAAPLSGQEWNLMMGVLISGIEGGINYWAQIVDQQYPPGTTKMDFQKGGKMQPRRPDGSEDYYHWAELLPMTPGGAIFIRDLEESPQSMQEFQAEVERRKAAWYKAMEKHYGHEAPESPPKWPGPTLEERKGWVTYRLDLPALQKAWNRLKLEYPKVYQGILDENYDAITGDMLIQLAVLGELTYG
jgi:hypothetical protein